MIEKATEKAIEINRPDEKVEEIQKKMSVKDITNKKSKKWLIMLIAGAVSFIGGVSCLLVALLVLKTEVVELDFSHTSSGTESSSDTTYSLLTGEPLADANLKNAPTFCVQIPNGTDGARPQVGLTQAGAIYEAIAEAGITRFDAVFQNPTSAIIGPIRSLRSYFLDFAAPFGCTITHAGGAYDALIAVRNGEYRDLDESYRYMYRSGAGGRRWNNLFTTSAKLKQFNADNGYESSEIRGFSRMTPEESHKARVNDLATHKLSITSPANGDTSELVAKINNISFSFASSANYNVKYTYDMNNNNYPRSYQSGSAHEVYECPNDDLGDKSPESVCTLTNLAPSVVIAMIVNERRAADNYHEDITMIGVGDAYIFQNGTVIKVNWSKPARNEQIKFIDGSGNEIKLAPGQVFVSAVPHYGSVEY